MRSANLFFLFVELGYLIALSIIVYIVLFIRQKNGHPEEEVYLFQVKNLFNKNKKDENGNGKDENGNGNGTGNQNKDENKETKETGDNEITPGDGHV